jgi:hypothetical protein
MASNERQADFFERLEAQSKGMPDEFGTKDLARWANLGERQARRVIVGEADLTCEMANLILRHAPESIADALSDYLHEGTDRLSIDVAVTAQDFNAHMGDSLKALGELLQHHTADAADGVLTESEKDRQIAICNQAMRLVAKMKTAIANTPIGTRRKANPVKPALKLNEAASA